MNTSPNTPQAPEENTPKITTPPAPVTTFSDLMNPHPEANTNTETPPATPSENTTKATPAPEFAPATAQEKITAAMGSLVFLIPFMMDKRTEFTVLYMRQNFMILLILLVLSVIASFFSFGGFFQPIFWFSVIVGLILMLFLMMKAYTGSRFTLPFLYNWSIKIIQLLKLENVFSPVNEGDIE